jgi:hypothetical protein
MTGFFDEVSLPLWSDNPAREDLLGFEDISKPIAQAIRRERLNPIAVGIYGPWGSGKTTVLGLLAAELAVTGVEVTPEGDKKRRVIVVETSPWAYDPNLDVRATLIGEVLDEVQAYADEALGIEDDVKEGIRTLVSKVRWSKAVALAAKTAITMQVPDWDSITNVLNLGGEDASGVETDPTMNSFKADFKKALEGLPDIERVVVLVDDLDRCLPESVVATLEGIKLFLAVDKMAFVIAYDEGPVVEAIKVRYPMADKPAVVAKQYLEKIIQIPVPIPRLGEDEVATYLAMTMLGGLIEDTEVGRIATHAATRRSAGERPLLDGHGVALEGDAADRVALAKRLAPLLTVKLEGNPRRIKRFLNDFWMRSSIAKARTAGIDPDPLAKLMVLEHSNLDRFKDLIAWSAEGTAPDILARIEEGDLTKHADWASKDLRDWAALEPKLSGLNLRPYLELAASLRAIEFAGPSLTPELRVILDEIQDRSGAIRTTGHGKVKALAPEQRAILAAALVGSIPQFEERQGDLAEVIPHLVGGDDAVGRIVVEEVRKIDAPKVDPAVFLRMQQAHVASIDAFLAGAKGNPAYAVAAAALGTE